MFTWTLTSAPRSALIEASGPVRDAGTQTKRPLSDPSDGAQRERLPGSFHLKSSCVMSVSESDGKVLPAADDRVLLTSCQMLSCGNREVTSSSFSHTFAFPANRLPEYRGHISGAGGRLFKFKSSGTLPLTDCKRRFISRLLL